MLRPNKTQRGLLQAIVEKMLTDFERGSPAAQVAPPWSAWPLTAPMPAPWLAQPKAMPKPCHRAGAQPAEDFQILSGSSA